VRAWILVVAIVATGFDHAKHQTATQDTLTCTSCHALTKTGALGAKPGHAQCFGKCHGPAPVLPAKGKKLATPPLCTTCHTQRALDAGTDKAAFRVMPPPRADFALQTGHKRHAAIACDKCHAQSKPAPHARCAGCHDGRPTQGPPMSLCTGCHQAADPAAQLGTSIPVRSAFSHAKHATRGAAGKCATCHATDTDARALPHPTTAQCATAGCHDGKAAFSTTQTCTRCHQDEPPIRVLLERPEAPFSHDFHLAYLAFLPCTACHALSKSGEVGLANHAACAPCHEDDFVQRKPKTCGACHDATEPWRKLIPDRPSLPSTDFGASLDHTKHANACASCHALTTTSMQLRPPRGHVSCSGTKCHTVSGGPAPSLGSCDGCHELGMSRRRQAQRVAAAWSVRKLFVHATHPQACTSCHLDMTAPDVMSLATPPKPTCAPCHDGQTSFKLTGTSCARCHPPK
jgi:c(7)-type cytochrome triheme protein